MALTGTVQGVVFTSRLFVDGTYLPAGFEIALPVTFALILVLWIAPYAILLAGYRILLMPGARGRHIVSAYGLGALPDRDGPLREIRDFLAAEAPELVTMANLGRMAPLAFVYPTGWRRSAIGLTGGLVRLWRADRAAARAVLLHEIAHYRQGDPLVIGAGDLLPAMLKAVPLMVLAGAGLILALDLLLVPEVDALRHVMANVRRVPTASVPGDGWGLMAWYLGFAVPFVRPDAWATVGALLLVTAQLLIVPVAAVWVAELVADRFVAATPDGRVALRSALDRSTLRRDGWRVLLGWLELPLLTHPPTALRRVVATRLSPAMGLAAILALFVAALGLALLLALVVSWTGAYARGWTAMGLGEFVLRNAPGQIASTTGSYGLLALVLLVWPRLGSWWERLTAGRALPAGPADRWVPAAFGAGLSAILLLAAGSTPDYGPRAVAPPDEQPRITIVPSTVVEPGQPVRIEFANLDAAKQNWIAIVPRNWQPEQYIDDPRWWTFVSGSSGIIELRPEPTREPLEARLFLDWPAGGVVIHDRRLFYLKARPE